MLPLKIMGVSKMPEKNAMGKIELTADPVKAKASRDFIFETIVDATINTSTACKLVNVAGFRKFSLMGRFDGQPSAKIRFEVNQNNIMLAQEIFTLNTGGWYNFSKVYEVFAPNIGVVIYEFPTGLKAKMHIYAGY
jgi:hypothetical protein